MIVWLISSIEYVLPGNNSSIFHISMKKISDNVFFIFDQTNYLLPQCDMSIDFICP